MHEFCIWRDISRVRYNPAARRTLLKDYGGSNIGVSNVSNGMHRLFSADDLRILDSLSVYAAMAIQNARNMTELSNAAGRVLRHTTMF